MAYRNDSLHVEGVALDALAKEHQTPLFVYSKAAMLSALSAYQRGFVGRNALICYAMKANSSLAILQLFAQNGCGFDIVSGGELARVLKAGADPKKIIFSGVGKTRSEMRVKREAIPEPKGYAPYVYNNIQNSVDPFNPVKIGRPLIAEKEDKKNKNI